MASSRTRTGLNGLGVALLGIVLLFDPRPAEAFELGEYKDFIRQDIAAECKTVEDHATAAECLASVYRAWVLSGDYQLNKHAEFMFNVTTRARYIGLYEAPCTDDKRSINFALEHVQDLGPVVSYRISSCGDVAGIWKALTGVPISYMLCAADFYTYEVFRDCLGARLNPELPPRVARTLLESVLPEDEQIAAAMRSKATAIPQLLEQANGPPIKRDAAYAEQILADVRMCLRNPEGIRDRNVQMSNFVKSFYRARPLGASGSSGPVTCVDFVSAMVELGYIDAAEAQQLARNFDRCAPGRATGAPFPSEAGHADLTVAAEFYCDPEQVFWVGKLGEYLTKFTVRGQECRMEAPLLPGKTFGYYFKASTCANKGLGQAQCAGVIRQICRSDVQEREVLDCLSFDFTAEAEISFSYDASSCSWNASGITVDPSSYQIGNPFR